MQIIRRELGPIGANSYLIIDYNGKDVMVPFIDEFITDVNDDYIMVNEIEGLF